MGTFTVKKMALNTAHANGGVLIHAGESILLFCDNVTMEFSGQDGAEFKGSKQGRLYLTTHRMIFNNKKTDDKMVSFSFPFVALKDVELEQPVFGANYIKGKVRAQPGGNFTGEAKFKLHFKSGGAIDFGQAMLKAAQMAGRHSVSDAPPPYPGINGTNGYSNGAAGGGGAGGWTAPHANGSTRMTSAERKAAEASAPPVQTGYYDPNNPGQAYVPPPAYYNDPPPGYADTRDKKND